MVFKRIRDIVVASVNEGLDKIEDPIIMVNQYLRDMSAEITKAKDAVVKQETLQESFLRQLNDAKEIAHRREKQAKLAFASGEEDLARKALAEKKYYEEKVTYYQDLYDKTISQVNELNEQLGVLKEKFTMLKDRKSSLAARANAAKTKEHMRVSLDRYNGASTLREFDRMEDRVREIEIRNSIQEPSSPSSLSKLSQLEWKDEIEKEIEKMRQEKGQQGNKPDAFSE